VAILHSVLVAQDNEIFVKNNVMKVNERANKVNLNLGLDGGGGGSDGKDEEKTMFKWALFELFGIVVLGKQAFC